VVEKRASDRVDAAPSRESGGVSILTNSVCSAGGGIDMIEFPFPRSTAKVAPVKVVGCCHKKPSSYVHFVGVRLLRQRVHVGYSRSQRSLRLRHCVQAIARRRLLRGRARCGTLLAPSTSAISMRREYAKKSIHSMDRSLPPNWSGCPEHSAYVVWPTHSCPIP
jgi:hypothetical protein